MLPYGMTGTSNRQMQHCIQRGLMLMMVVVIVVVLRVMVIAMVGDRRVIIVAVIDCVMIIRIPLIRQTSMTHTESMPRALVSMR